MASFADMIKIKTFLVLFFVTITFLSFPFKAISQAGQVFAAVKKGNKWGFIDTVGKVQIPFNLEKEGSFRQGVANVKYGKEWGYIDKKGTLILKPRLLSANPFHDGRALVSYFDPKDSLRYRGYINKFGYMITVLANNEKGNDYNDGYARICSQTKTGLLFGFKDSLDSFAIKAAYEDAGDFHEGMAAVKSGGKWGFIDQKNNLLVHPQFDDAYHFQEGMAYVSQGSNTSFINSKGEKVFTVGFDEVDVLVQDGMICFRDHGKIGFMNARGKVVIKPVFTAKTLTRFKDGLAPIQADDGKYGYINKKGEFVIKPQFEDAQFFFNNYAVVKQDGKYGFINKKGRWVIKPEYDDAYEFEPADFY